MQEASRHVADDLSLSYLPECWLDEILPHLGSSRKHTQWSTSYVSADTFFENKHGKSIVVSSKRGQVIDPNL